SKRSSKSKVASLLPSVTTPSPEKPSEASGLNALRRSTNLSSASTTWASAAGLASAATTKVDGYSAILRTAGGKRIGSFLYGEGGRMVFRPRWSPGEASRATVGPGPGKE